MRWIALLVMCSCAPMTPAADELARRVCTSEGMWCQDAEHSRCCRGLKCVDSTCVKKQGKSADDREQL
jgi:hypothetical protein